CHFAPDRSARPDRPGAGSGPVAGTPVPGHRPAVPPVPSHRNGRTADDSESVGVVPVLRPWLLFLRCVGGGTPRVLARPVHVIWLLRRSALPGALSGLPVVCVKVARG